MRGLLTREEHKDLAKVKVLVVFSDTLRNPAAK